jgi:hypothetical protein
VSTFWAGIGAVVEYSLGTTGKREQMMDMFADLFVLAL